MADNGMQQALMQLLGQQQALSALGPAYQKAVGRFDQNYYEPYSQTGESSLSMLGNSLGLGGAGGNEAATGAFQAGPGYQFALDQGLEALDRRAAGRGMLASGPHSKELIDYAQGRANQEFGNWQSQLGNLSNLGLSAAQGQTGRQGALANLDYGYGTGQANIIQNSTNRMADALAPKQQQQSSGLGSAIAGGLNLGGSLLGLGMGGITGGSLGGGIGSALGRFFQ